MFTWITHTIASLGYAGIVLLMFLENVFPPIPSELIMPLAGFEATRGKLSLVGVVLAGTLGSVLGALPLYYLGAKAGEDRLKALADKYGRWLTVSADDIGKARAWFDRHGAGVIVFGRLVPAVRSLISVPAGVSHVSLPKFLLLTALGTGLWTTLLAFAGRLLGDNYTRVQNYVNPATNVVLGVIVLVYVMRLFRHKGGKKQDDAG